MTINRTDLDTFKSANPSQGLSEETAKDLLQKFGSNDISEESSFPLLREIIHLIVNPLILILIIASIISVILQNNIDAFLIISMVVMGVIINFVQTYRSHKAMQDLRDKVAPTATVIRNSHKFEIQRRYLVPGDIIELSAGDLIPADCGLLKCCDFHVQEAMLTGESFPAEKEVSSTEEPTMIYFGSSVANGSATAVVLFTGKKTKFGNIAERLSAPPPETEFDRGIRNFGYLILKTVFILVILVFLAALLRHQNLIESLLFAVALAVGLTPEFLPVISAVTLTRGAMQLAKSKVVIKHLSAIQNFGSIDILCSDKTGTITSGEMKFDQAYNGIGEPSDKVFYMACLNSHLQSGIRSPLDSCLINAKHIDLELIKKIDEIPFDFERRRVSVILEENGVINLITKGAPEGVLKASSFYEENGTNIPLTDEVRSQISSFYNGLHEKGLRCLAVAHNQIPEIKEHFASNEEQDLVFLGLVTFTDPLLPNVRDSIEKLESDGVKIKILTGDNEKVAQFICQQVGLDENQFILGDQIDLLDDLALEAVAESKTLFARVSPSQKTRILFALKSRKHVVGFMGDGVNDAPSLHAADIGISFSTAVDVAKHSSDIILTQRDLSVLHNGIIQGRMAFGNLMKYLLMGTSSNFGNMFSMAAASLFLPFLPMLPVQILLNNFLYDLAQLPIPTDHVDSTFTIKPRRWQISIIRNFMIFIGPLSSIFDFVTFYILLSIFNASVELFHTGWFVESLLTQTIVIFSIRTAGSAFKSLPSLPLATTVLTIIFVSVLIPFTSMGKELGFIPIPLNLMIAIIFVTLLYMILVEYIKRKIMANLLGS